MRRARPPRQDSEHQGDGKQKNALAGRSCCAVQIPCVPENWESRLMPSVAASSCEENGAGEGNRTRDLRITSAPLYQLSYAGPQSLRKCYVISSGCACQSTTRRCRGAHRHYPHSCERLRAFALGSKASLLLGAAVHKNGADDGIRTRDSRLGKPLPYHWATSARKALRPQS